MNKRRGRRIDGKAWEQVAYSITKKLAGNDGAIEDSDIPDLSGWSELSTENRNRAALIAAQQKRHPLTNEARKEIAEATGKAERTVSNVLEAWRQFFAQDKSLAPDKREAVKSGISRFIVEESIKD